MRLRRGRPDDAGALARLFHDAVRIGAAPAHDRAARAAWSPAEPDPGAFSRRLASMAVLVAEDAHGPAGFAALTTAGRLDLFHVRPDQRRQGAATLLYDGIEATARAANLSRLDADATAMLRPFLARRGWSLSEGVGPADPASSAPETWPMQKAL